MTDIAEYYVGDTATTYGASLPRRDIGADKGLLRDAFGISST